MREDECMFLFKKAITSCTISCACSSLPGFEQQVLKVSLSTQVRHHTRGVVVRGLLLCSSSSVAANLGCRVDLGLPDARLDSLCMATRSPFSCAGECSGPPCIAGV
jgi:hypothetical protein